MFRQIFTKKRIFCRFLAAVLCAGLTSLSAQASDLSRALWGGPGSQTTVTQLYVPPPLETETISVPMSDSAAMLTAQSQLMLGTPGATTLPSGGVIATNGVATATYVSPNQTMTGSGLAPAAHTTLIQTPLMQSTPQQPAVESRWSFSTIKDTTFEPVTLYDSRFGGYVTTYQERQTESVLPWLHRKQVVKYSSPTESQTPVAAVNERLGTLADRVFPISAVPISPAQADLAPTLPLQTSQAVTTHYPATTYSPVMTPASAAMPTIPVQAAPLSTVPSSAVSSPTVLRYGEFPVVPAVSVPPNEASVILPTTTSSAIVRSVDSMAVSPIAISQPTASPNTAPNTMSSVISDGTSAVDPANHRPSLPDSESMAPIPQQVLYHPQASQSSVSPDTSPTQTKQANTPTLAPAERQPNAEHSSSFRLSADPLAGDSGQSIVGSAYPVANVPSNTPLATQPERIQDSLPRSESLGTVEAPASTPLPIPTQPEQTPAPQQSPQNLEPSAATMTTPSASPQADGPTSTTSSRPLGSQSRLNISPTRVSELFKW